MGAIQAPPGFTLERPKPQGNETFKHYVSRTMYGVFTLIVYTICLGRVEWVKTDDRFAGLWQWCNLTDTGGLDALNCTSYAVGGGPAYFEACRALSCCVLLLTLLHLWLNISRPTYAPGPKIFEGKRVVFLPILMQVMCVVIAALFALNYRSDERWKPHNPSLDRFFATFIAYPFLLNVYLLWYCDYDDRFIALRLVPIPKKENAEPKPSGSTDASAKPSASATEPKTNVLKKAESRTTDPTKTVSTSANVGFTSNKQDEKETRPKTNIQPTTTPRPTQVRESSTRKKKGRVGPSPDNNLEAGHSGRDKHVRFEGSGRLNEESRGEDDDKDDELQRLKHEPTRLNDEPRGLDEDNDQEYMRYLQTLEPVALSIDHDDYLSSTTMNSSVPSESRLYHDNLRSAYESSPISMEPAVLERGATPVMPVYTLPPASGAATPDRPPPSYSRALSSRSSYIDMPRPPSVATVENPYDNSYS